MLAKKFSKDPDHKKRAVQTWQILVGRAMNQQIINYKDLSVLIYGRAAPRVMPRILGHVAYYCQHCKLPALTTIVIGKHSGIPGINIPVRAGDVNNQRAKVFNFDCYNIVPPSDDELHEAFTTP